MDDQISDADIATLFNNTVCLYKGTPAYVSRCDGRVLTIKILKNNKIHSVDFSFKDFKPPNRLGMVNFRKNVGYIQRKSMRQWQVGINAHNTVITLVDMNLLPDNYYDWLDRICLFKVKEMDDCMNGVYPSFKESIELAQKHTGVFAFDRQFAVNYNREIYYKTFGKVGVIPKDSDKLDEIQFKDEYQFLSLLLGDKYEKGIGSCSLR